MDIFLFFEVIITYKLYASVWRFLAEKRQPVVFAVFVEPNNMTILTDIIDWIVAHVKLSRNNKWIAEYFFFSGTARCIFIAFWQVASFLSESRLNVSIDSSRHPIFMHHETFMCYIYLTLRATCKYNKRKILALARKLIFSDGL